MALRVPSHLGWPFGNALSPLCHFCTILDEYALQDGWHRGRPCAGGCDEGDGSRKGAIHLAEHTHQEWCQRKYQVTCGIPIAIPSVTAPSLSHPNPQPNAVGPQQYVWMCEKKLFAGWKAFPLPDFKEALPVRQYNQKKLFRGWKFFPDRSPLERKANSLTS